jgi:uncharacterized protein (TIGR00266 family)
MQVLIPGKPSYAMATLTLEYGESAYVERGSIAALSDGIDVRGSLGGDGIIRALKRRTLGDEPLIFTEVRAQAQDAWVSVAPPYPGDIEDVELDGSTNLLIDTGALLAYSMGISSDVRYSGLKTVVLHEGVVMLEVSGRGSVIMSSYGAIVKVDLAADEKIVIDTGHLVGFTSTVTFDIGVLESITKSVVTGEGLVAQLTGPGRVYMQTRAEQQLRSWLFPQRPQNAH